MYAGSLSMFGLSNVTVSEFINPSGRHFRSFSLIRSSCQGGGDWTGGDTWYPGYRWRLCHCPLCDQAVGWEWGPASSLASQWVGLRLDRVTDWEDFLMGPLSHISHLLNIRAGK